ncbi:GAF domain-containing protein [Sphingomonas sp. RS6]
MTVHFLNALRRPRGAAARQRAIDALVPVAGDEPALIELLDAVRSVLATPAALLVLADGAGMRVAAASGAAVGAMAAAVALCGHTLAAPDGMLCVPDLRREPRFCDDPAVMAPAGPVYFAGVGLFSGTHGVGALCGIDSHAHGPISFGQRGMLEKLALTTAIELGAAPPTRV